MRDIPVDRMQDPWGIEFAPVFMGRDTCRTPMVWRESEPNGGFSIGNRTWLPISEQHMKRAALDQAARSGSICAEFADFLKWRKTQPALMEANRMSELSGGPHQIVFDRTSDKQTLRCCFDFDTLTACLLYTSPSPRDGLLSRMPSSA